MHNNQYKLCPYAASLKKTPLLIHSNLDRYILRTYIRLCGTAHLLESDLKHTQKRKNRRRRPMNHNEKKKSKRKKAEKKEEDRKKERKKGRKKSNK